MKAILFDRYGGPEVLTLGEAKRPEPKEKEVLIRVLAAAVNAADWHIIQIGRASCRERVCHRV